MSDAISAANPALPQQTIDAARALQAQLETYSENFHDPTYIDQCLNLLNNLLSHIGENPPASIQTQVQTFKDKLREQREGRQRHTDREKGALLRALGVEENVAALLASIARYRSTIGVTGVTEAQTETARHELIKVVEANHAALVENGGAAFKEWNEYKAAKILVDNLQPAKVQADYEAKKAKYDTLVAAAASS